MKTVVLNFNLLLSAQNDQVDRSSDIGQILWLVILGALKSRYQQKVYHSRKNKVSIRQVGAQAEDLRNCPLAGASSAFSLTYE